MAGADRRQLVLRYVLERQASARPHDTYALFQDGDPWTFAETRDRVARVAHGLWSLGVRPGHRVLSWQPNGATALLAWFGANWIGASYVPINTAYRGALLQHVIDNSGAAILIGHPSLIPRLSEITVARLGTVIPTGPAAWRDDRFRVLDWSALESATDCAGDLEQPIEPWDEQSIIFTSGTTGPSKGVLSSYRHLATTAQVSLGPLDAPDLRWLLQMPLFHVGGTVIAYGMLLLGRSIAVVDRFSTERFWQDVDRMNCTNAVVGGAMVSFLLRQPESPADRQHALRYALIMPFNELARQFRERFGVDVQTHYNMSETSVPILSDINPSVVGQCGRLRPGIEARIVDAHDFEVAPGEVGELILRAEQPWTLAHGYNAMPEATAAAWRNGWFHTGDALRRDEAGRFYFVDRVKDAIRRRGENISSFDVEAEVLSHPSVREVAAIPVPSEHGEDEVMIVVAPAPEQTIDPAMLFDYLRGRMAHFMLPRYIRSVAELPRTPTEKVRKFELRRAGVTADTWDREAAGIRVSREL
ncbi:MAG: ATP-dependent acyl-CoA ligase [Gammaproteobacteria bacterium]|nr:ATP-dependent acyl-CoA ligase [Gammaproteobacteria bacterium]